MKLILFIYFVLSALTFGVFLFLLLKEFRRAAERQEPPGTSIIVLILAFVFMMFIEAIAAMTIMLT